MQEKKSLSRGKESKFGGLEWPERNGESSQNLIHKEERVRGTIHITDRLYVTQDDTVSKAPPLSSKAFYARISFEAEEGEGDG